MAGNLVMHLITFHFGNTKKTAMPPLIPYRALEKWILLIFYLPPTNLMQNDLELCRKRHLPSAIFVFFKIKKKISSFANKI